MYISGHISFLHLFFTGSKASTIATYFSVVFSPMSVTLMRSLKKFDTVRDTFDMQGGSDPKLGVNAFSKGVGIAVEESNSATCWVVDAFGVVVLTEAVWESVSVSSDFVEDVVSFFC